MGQATVSASSVNVRSGPDTKEKYLGRLDRGAKFTYSSDNNGWLQTVYKNQTAYVCKKYTKTEEGSTSETAATTTETAATTTTETASTTTSWSGKKLLNANQEKSAIEYNQKKNSGSVWKDIQNLVGVSPTGNIDGDSVQAVAAWQKSNGLTADGKFGDKSFKKSGLNASGATTTTTETTTTETTTTETTTTTQTQETESSWSGERLLSSSKAKQAVTWNKKQKNINTVWKDIQRVVGVAQTGVIDEDTIQAIASWQKSNGLTADGKFGDKSYNKAGITKPSGSDGGVDLQDAAEQAITHKLIEGDSKNLYVRRNAGGAGRFVRTLVDLETGKRFDISWARPSGTYHSDVTPNDKTATDVVKSIVNPSVSPSDYDYWKQGRAWNWAGHPGAIQLANGAWVACGFHLRPHGAPQGGNPDSPWNQSSPKSRPSGYSSKTPQGMDAWKPGGHFCLYYNQANGGGTESCRVAVEKAKKYKAPV